MFLTQSTTTRTSNSSRRWSHSLLAGAALMILAPGLASADIVHVMQDEKLNGTNPAGEAPIDLGTNLPGYSKQAGAGFEQAAVACAGAAPKVCTMIGIGSYKLDDLGMDPGFNLGAEKGDRLQTMAVTFEVGPEGPVKITRQYIMKELNDGDRYRDGLNPAVATIDEEQKLFMVIANYPPKNRVEVFAAPYQAVEVEGTWRLEQMSPATSVLQSDNDDCAEKGQRSLALDKVTQVEGNNVFHMVGAGGCNGNGSDAAYIYDFTATCPATLPGTVDPLALPCTVLVGTKLDAGLGQIERPRGEIDFIGENAAGERIYVYTYCAGDTQPPRDGIGITFYNADTKQIISKQYLLQSGRNAENQETYYLMPDSAVLGIKKDGAESVATIGMEYYDRPYRKRGDKGAAYSKLAIIEARTDGTFKFVMEPTPNPVEMFRAAHAEVFACEYGQTDGPVPAMCILDSSLTGVQEARISIFTHDAANNTLVLKGSKNIPSFIDNGTVANYLGENPGTQGHNKLYGIMMDNPHYGVAGSPLADVKKGLLIAATARRKGQGGILTPKLALDFVVMEMVADTEPLLKRFDSSGNPVEPGTPGDQPLSGKSSGGCSVAGNVSSGGSLVALLGLALATATRRRRRRS